jgi:hypothetical protein
MRDGCQVKCRSQTKQLNHRFSPVCKGYGVALPCELLKTLDPLHLLIVVSIIPPQTPSRLSVANPSSTPSCGSSARAIGFLLHFLPVSYCQSLYSSYCRQHGIVTQPSAAIPLCADNGCPPTEFLRASVRRTANGRPGD